MAKCAYCGKGVTFGHNVSHSNRKTSRTWKPNIRKVKVVDGGTHKTVAKGLHAVKRRILSDFSGSGKLRKAYDLNRQRKRLCFRCIRFCLFFVR